MHNTKALLTSQPSQPNLVVNSYSTSDMLYALKCSGSCWISNGANKVTTNEYTAAVTTAGGIFAYYDYPFNFNEVFEYVDNNHTISIRTKDGSNIIDAYQKVIVEAGATWEKGNKNNSSCILYTISADNSVDVNINVSGIPSGSTFELATIENFDSSKTYVINYAWGFIS